MTSLYAIRRPVSDPTSRTIRLGQRPHPVPLARMLCSTRLVDLVNTMDPKLAAATFVMDPEGVMIYLADHVHESRLLDQNEIGS